jgi:hypothetical protein
MINDLTLPCLPAGRRTHPHRGGRGEGDNLLKDLTPCAMRFAILSLYLDRQFDEEGSPLGFVVPNPDISIVIRDDGVNNGQP